MRYLLIGLLALAGCSFPGMEGRDDTWALHDVQLARLGKARGIECRAACQERACFEECVEEMVALLDSWCRLGAPAASPACRTLDDLVAGYD
jgi:hypothetical protein